MNLLLQSLLLSFIICSTEAAPFVPNGGSMLRKTATRAVSSDEGKLVEVTFQDGSTYQFHALWLRDACRDETHVVRKAGERLLTSTPVGPLSCVDPNQLRASDVTITDDEELIVRWNGASENVRKSKFSVDFLKRYAPVVGMLTTTETHLPKQEGWSDSGEMIPTWLEPYTGYPAARAPADDEIRYFDGQDRNADFIRFHHADIMNSPRTLLTMIRHLLCDGVVLIDSVPDEGDSRDAARELHAFIEHSLGGLQKDPTRSERNWKIVHKPGAASVSYDPQKRLYQHTDSSIPPHGIPGLVLSMHYVKGHGANTLTDGFAVAKELKQKDPEAFQLLATYGYDGERDFAASRMDSTQEIAKGLVIRRKHPIFSVDEDNNITRVQYNEVFRMPLTLPFELFPKWFAAFSKFVGMVHSDKYQRTVMMKENTILLVNNWRVLHGRAAAMASPDRHLVGGTIVRESVYSKAMQLANALKEQD